MLYFTSEHTELVLRKIIEKTSAENGRPLTEGMLEKMFETTKLEKEKDINKNSLGLLDLFRFKRGLYDFQDRNFVYF